jgi:hypothetical protein
MWQTSCWLYRKICDGTELSEHYSGLCLRRVTAIATQTCHVGHGLWLVSAVGMLYNTCHMPWTHTHEESDDDLRLCWCGGLGGQGPRKM